MCKKPVVFLVLIVSSMGNFEMSGLGAGNSVFYKYSVFNTKYEFDHYAYFITGRSKHTYPFKHLNTFSSCGIVDSFCRFTHTFSSPHSSARFNCIVPAKLANYINLKQYFSMKSFSGSTLPLGLKLGNGLPHFVLSVYDEDYLPYTFPGTGASFKTNVAADGIPEGKLIDIEGVVSAALPIAVYIPYTNNSSSSLDLPAYKQIISIAAEKTANGVEGLLQLSFDAAPLPTGRGTIRASVQAIGSDVRVKKLDIQSGTGNDNMGVLLGKFSYPAGDGFDSAFLEVRAIAGIPDRMFDTPDNAGNNMTHLFLYRPISSPSGQIWLSNNLGAAYAEIFNSKFSPLSQAVSADDPYALGSWFQWGRRPDGHERFIRNHETGWVRFVYYDPVFNRADNPSIPNRIANTIQREPDIAPDYDWRLNPDSALWQGEAAVNNPCPFGYRLPFLNELENEVQLFEPRSMEGAFNSVLKLPGFGWVLEQGGIFTDEFRLTTGYWTATASGHNSIAVILENPTMSQDNIKAVRSIAAGRIMGFNVRCIKN